MLLAVRNLGKRYQSDGPWALRGINLDVQEGEFVAILGPSGAGKSTLIRCFNRLLEPTEGDVLWEGRSLLALDSRALRAQRRLMGMIFQDFHLVDRLSVLSNVLVGTFGRLRPWQVLTGRYPAEDWAEAWRALDRVGLTPYAYRLARELSGGQRQRVAIARALAQRPRVLLGDEPVSNLDPATSHVILSLLEQLNREDGITLILNLHSVELARRYARRIIGMNQGRIVFDGPPSALTAAQLAHIYGAEPQTWAQDARMEPPALPRHMPSSSGR